MKSDHTFLSVSGMLLCLPSLAVAQLLSYNTGTLGAGADAVHTAGVSVDQPGVLPGYNDFSCTYAGGNRSTLPFQAAVNPAAASPFTIEFWARPTNSDNDDVPVNNRIGSGDRSGWVFFQRGEGTGWNFRMYNGTGDNMGWNLTGGTSTWFAWSHVVATWNGTVAKLYVNGVDINAANTSNGIYNPSTTATFSIGALADGNSPMTGSVDEVAFYATALSAARILEHYEVGTGTAVGCYSAMVSADGPLLYFQQNPPSARIAKQGENQVVTFTGILTQSSSMTEGSWEDLEVASPYTVTPTSEAPKLFFRARR